MHKMAAKYTNVRFAKYDCELEGNEALATKLKIKELPTIIAFREGEEMARFTGASSVGEVMGLSEIWHNRHQST